MATRTPNARGAGDRLRAQLVEAASDLLLTPQLIALPSLRSVARACDVSPAAVYLHFASIDTLLDAVLDRQLQLLRQHIEKAIPDVATPVLQLDAFARAYVSWGLTHPGAYQLLFESADRLGPDRDSAHEGNPERWYLLTRAAELVAASGIGAPTPPSLTAIRLWTALHGLVSLRVHKPANDWPTLNDEVAHLLETFSR